MINWLLLRANCELVLKKSYKQFAIGADEMKIRRDLGLSKRREKIGVFPLNTHKSNRFSIEIQLRISHNYNNFFLLKTSIQTLTIVEDS